MFDLILECFINFCYRSIEALKKRMQLLIDSDTQPPLVYRMLVNPANHLLKLLRILQQITALQSNEGILYFEAANIGIKVYQWMTNSEILQSSSETNDYSRQNEQLFTLVCSVLENASNPNTTATEFEVRYHLRYLICYLVTTIIF